VVGWAISAVNDRHLTIKALEMAANKKVDRPWKKQGVVPV